MPNPQFVSRSSRGERLLFAVALFFLTAIPLPAQFNSWTKPTSGNWEEPFWSLGVPPNISQSGVMFTNEGWKALAITSTTVRDFPSSLRIARLTVASPSNTFNTLLLNFAGVQSPFIVEDFFRLGSNSTFITLSSALHVGQNFYIDGT